MEEQTKNISVPETDITIKDGISEISAQLINTPKNRKVNGISVYSKYYNKEKQLFLLKITKFFGNNCLNARLVISKPIIHRHLNITYKSLKVLEQIETQVLQKETDLFWDWEIYKKTKIQLRNTPSLDNIDHVVYNILTKSPVIIYGDSFDQVFSAFFTLVSPINNPAYNDFNWTFNPEITPDINNYSGINLMRKINDEPLFLSVERVKERLHKEPAVLDLVYKTVSAGKTSPLIHELTIAITNGKIENISNTVGKIFGLMKELSLTKDVSKFQKINNLTKTDMLLLEEISYAIKK